MSNPAHSIMFEGREDRARAEAAEPPTFFSDLNFDQIVAAVTLGKDEYDLKPFFYVPLQEVDAVLFRHEVMRDLEDVRLLDSVRAFAKGMHAVREQLAEIDKRYYEHQKMRWFLRAVDLYGETVSRLSRDLSDAKCRSRGLVAFGDYASHYVSSEHFRALVAEATELKTALSAIRYNVYIRGARVEVHPHSNEADYSAEIAAAFERFRQGAVKEHVFEFNDGPEMNHIEAQVVDGVAQLHQETFSKLANFRTANGNFLDHTIVAFDREIQFYVAYLDYIGRLKKVGLHFCYPRVSELRTDLYNYDGFDLALAGKLIGEHATPVCNDFYLRGPERVIVVSGPNQGGKTTFARTFGQLHYLGSLGFPVPGTSAQLHLSDGIFAHFDRQEQMTSLRGKLEDDIVRIREILDAATPRSIIVINEIFASTALRDAVFLSKKIAARILELDVPCVWVTFLDEVASLSEKTVSMVSTVRPDNPAQRTFKIVRQPADGLAYAMSIAEKYRLTYRMLKERARS